MIKIFIPEIKGKRKTSIRGFWRNDEGRLFYDYIRLFNDFNRYIYCRKLEAIKNKYNQECIAFIDTDTKDKLYIYFDENKTDVLNNRITKTIDKRNKKDLKATLKLWLKEYKGVTVYIDDVNYILESYYN